MTTSRHNICSDLFAVASVTTALAAGQRSRACPEAALGVGKEEDDTGILTLVVEINDGQYGVGATTATLFQLLDVLGGDVSEEREKRLGLPRGRRPSEKS